ncbi:GNAT family N-acetyltransferase [Streptomyces lydicus]|uniref:GNAT family N-acetyltransferase n=1 Tax=Streptomyces lydicus TaxID=47763 RepID=UPI0037BA52AC
MGAAYAVRRRTPLAGTDLKPENGWILFFFVDPAHRSGGLGRRLLTDALFFRIPVRRCRPSSWCRHGRPSAPGPSFSPRD